MSTAEEKAEEIVRSIPDRVDCKITLTDGSTLMKLSSNDLREIALGYLSALSAKNDAASANPEPTIDKLA